MAQKFPTIDYTDMLEDLKEDIASGYITEESTLYLVRQKEDVFVEAKGENVFPVIDYFYDSPALKEDIVSMTVADAKKLCFEVLEKLTDEKDEAFAAAVKLLTSDLKDYTAGNNKRNERLCKVVFEDKSGVPMMIYYDETDAADKITSVTASDLIKELESCM